MSFSNFLESAILTWALGNYTWYVGYGTADPGEDGSTAAEPTGGTGYARESYEPATVTNSGDNYFIENDSLITFNTATSSQGTITHVYVYDAVTAGNFLGSVSFSELGQSDINAVSGTIVKFLAQQCKVRLN